MNQDQIKAIASAAAEAITQTKEPAFELSELDKIREFPWRWKSHTGDFARHCEIIISSDEFKRSLKLPKYSNGIGWAIDRKAVLSIGWPECKALTPHQCFRYRLVLSDISQLASSIEEWLKTLGAEQATGARLVLFEHKQMNDRTFDTRSQDLLSIGVNTNEL